MRGEISGGVANCEIPRYFTYIGENVIKINEITIDDKEEYINLANLFYKSDAVMQKILPENFSKTFDYLLNDKTYAEIYMVKSENQNIGYFLISKTYSQEAGGMVLLIEEIYLSENNRNKGIGKIIFSFLKDRFHTYKRFRLELTSTNEKAKNYIKNLDLKNLHTSK